MCRSKEAVTLRTSRRFDGVGPTVIFRLSGNQRDNFLHGVSMGEVCGEGRKAKVPSCK